MPKNKKILLKLHESHIRGTINGALVTQKRICLCNLTNAVVKIINHSSTRIHINTIVLKHLYDKKPTEEYDFILDNLHTIVKYPDVIYKNKGSKRGDFCFVKDLKNNLYICSIEINTNDDITELEIATAFRVRNKNYLKNYSEIWSWQIKKPLNNTSL